VRNSVWAVRVQWDPPISYIERARTGESKDAMNVDQLVIGRKAISSSELFLLVYFFISGAKFCWLAAS